jgi:hypothetical protein
VQIVDQDIQCLLCDRVIAECRGGQLRVNPNYGKDVRQALTSRRCGHCGGRLVGLPVMAGWMDVEPATPFRRRSRAG